MAEVLLVVHVIICIFLIGIILIQPNSSDGLSGIGGGNVNSVLTSRSSVNVLTKTTYFLFAAFVINCIILAKLSLSDNNSPSLINTIEQGVEETTEGIKNKLEDIEIPISN